MLLHTKRIVLGLAGVWLALIQPAWADRDDRNKPINLEADTVDINDLTKVSVYQGNVRLTQGTMLLTADKLVVVQDDEGLSKGTATGNPSYFHQKRDGVDELIEGWAQRIEYDAKQDKLEMHNQARIKRGEDQVRGDTIIYEAQTESYRVLGGKDFASEYNPKGRVRAVIQPKRPAGAPQSNPGLPLQPSPGVNSPN